MDILEYRRRKKYKVLLVEDDSMLNEIYQYVLEHAGYTVLSSKSGESALRKYSQNVSLILLDLMLPDISGLEVLKTIRKQDLTTPIMVLTNLSEGRYKEDVIEFAHTHYMVKSDYTPHQIMVAVEKLLMNNNAERSS